MAGVRNLTQSEAAERARVLHIARYDISLDLTDGVGAPGERSFRSTTTIQFSCTEPGATTFIEIAAERIRSATLNGDPVDTAGWSPERGLALPALAAQNTLVVDADFLYSTSGQGLHRTVDPVDKEVYLYSQFETTDAQRVFACFDQPDLKSVYAWQATVPAHWRVVSNMPVQQEMPAPDNSGAKVVHFVQSVRMSTYITALCAGPYHEVRETHDGIDLGILCRASMARFLDAGEIFLITRQGFDFFHKQFGVRYPLPKYDQLIVPEFNAGAMENFGAVTNAEPYFLFRSAVTDAEYEYRANVILHEMAHMWFGNLVTMRWWNDLWLNESFAEWASYWTNGSATRFTDSWTAFLSTRKNWGYRQDQLSSTHPVYCDMPDVAAVEVNFDGITYAKGASVIKQLVAYVGLDSFLAGLQAYFAKHAWGNATFDDLLTELETASGTALRKFAAEWLETAEVNTLRPLVQIGPDGTYSAVAVRQEAPADHPTLRSHRIAIGLYDLDGPDRLVRRRRIELTVEGERTDVPELVGVPAADVLLLNDDDLTYAKLRLDERSLRTVVEQCGIAGFDSSLPRALVWAAVWDMLRDAELPARDYVRLVLNGLPAERDINLVTTTQRQAAGALTYYADPAWAPTGWAALAATARAAADAAEPGGQALAGSHSDKLHGSGFQLAWARQYIGAAWSESELAELRGWLGETAGGEGGTRVPAGLAIDTELRWGIVQTLMAHGAAGEQLIEAELERDRTATGEKEATLARALIATPEAKAEVWRLLTSTQTLPNWQHRALLQGFQHPRQVQLVAPYAEKFFDVVADIWARRDNEPAQEFVILAYPNYQVNEATVAMTDAWLAEEGHPAPLRRLIAEGRDGVLRALRARATDIAAAGRD